MFPAPFSSHPFGDEAVTPEKARSWADSPFPGDAERARIPSFQGLLSAQRVIT